MIQTPETELEPCAKCNEPCQHTYIDLGSGEKLRFRDICQTCVDKIQAERAAIDLSIRLSDERELAREKEKHWKNVCPPLFRDTEIEKLPRNANRATILEWKYSPRGLMIFGGSGAGKTRTVFLLFRRLFDEGIGIEYTTASDFRFNAAAAIMDGTIEQWFDNIATVDVLFIDDLGQSKFTEMTEELLLRLLNHRTSNKLPTIVTTQYRADVFTAQFLRKERGDAVIRRLVEFCDPVEL